jgi:hypothetical protein
MSFPLAILPSDRRFTDSPDVGDRACICSRCSRPIPENEVPIRAWPESGAYEYRFHARCLGLQGSDPTAPEGREYWDAEASLP